MPSAKNPSPWLRRHRFLPLAFTLAAALAASAQAGTYEAFGPRDVVHPRGQPTTETFEFDVLEPGGPYLLQIRNGGTGGELGRVAQGSVWLNGTLVVRPFDSWRDGPVIEKPVTLAASNTLTIELAGRAGGVSIAILGDDDEVPAIIASVDPPPNAAGWHRGAVTVSFDCSDATSGIASCAGPVVLADEGASQIVTGEAVDRAGNVSQASVAVSIDTTPPDVLISSPVDPTVAGFSLTVEGSVSDTLSGVAAAELNGSPLTLDPGGEFARELDFPDTGFYEIEVLAVDVAGNETSDAFPVIQEKTEYLEIEVVYPVPGEAVSVQRETGWPLSLRLRARSLVGIAVGEAGAESLILPAETDRAFLVFDLGADGFFEPLCGFPENVLLPECFPTPSPPDGEVFLEFTLDTDRAGVEDSFGNDEVRVLTDSGEFGVPVVLVSDFFGEVIGLRRYGPATGGNVTDGYGYGPNDDLPGLVVLSDTGAGVFFTDGFDLVEPREARNLAGFFDTVSYELRDATLGTSVVASMTVPRFLFSPFTLYDFCPGINAADCPVFINAGRDVLARTDGGPVVGPVNGAEINDQLNASEVTLTIFAVNGTAPLTLSDQDGDGRVDSEDAQLAGFELLSRETTVRFRQFYDLIHCMGDNFANFDIFDHDSSGGANPLDAQCPPGNGGVVDPPP